MNFEINDLWIEINSLEVLYRKVMQKKYDFSKVSKKEIDNMIFPARWESISNKEEKIKILEEAIESQCLLLETRSLNEYFKSL